MNDFMVKPIDPQALSAMLLRWILQREPSLPTNVIPLRSPAAVRGRVS